MSKTKNFFVVLFLCGAVFSRAQTREDIKIFVPMPTGGTADQQKYFQENFSMETTAAGYYVADSLRDSDYVLKLDIRPNMVVYEDGTEEPAPPDEKQYVLELVLTRNQDNTEIVSFNFPFNELEEMYDFNLYLLYQAMANVPLTKLTAVLETDHWRNKWLYIRASFDYNVVAYQADESKENREWDNSAGTSGDWKALDKSRGLNVPAVPGGTLGVELQFLNWMAAELDLKLVLGSPDGYAIMPAIGLALKFPIKPSKHYMLEPYLGMDITAATEANFEKPTLYSLGGGFQLGVRGGSMGAVFANVSYMYNIDDEIHTFKDKNLDVYWNRWVLGFSIGYKLGFFNRFKDAAE